MLTIEEIETEYSNENIRKTNKQFEWHDRLPAIIEKELSERINHWIGVARPNNLYTKETEELLESLKRSIYLTTRKHLRNHDKDNRKG